MKPKPTHTPGPYMTDGVYIWTEESYKMVADFAPSFSHDEKFSDKYLLRMRGVGRGATRKEQKANAHLFSAAPDLLQAAEIALKELRLDARHGERDAVNAVKKLEAAIKKAKGEPNA